MEAKFAGQMQRKVIAGELKFAPAASGVGPRDVVVTASTGGRDRVGDILEQEGARFDNFRQTPTVLAQHDPAAPIARATSIGLQGNRIVARIEFPPEGTSRLSDEYLRLVKAGVVSAVSVGFLPIKSEPIRGGGVRYIEWEVLEVSFVSVPANPAARVTQKHGASRTPRLDAARRRLEEISPLARRCARVAALKAEAARAHERDVERLKREINELIES